MGLKHRKNVGVIGLGIVGSRAAANLRKAGFRVYIWNRSPKPLPNFLGSCAEVAGLCEVIELFVSDGQALAACIDSMLPALTREHVIINHATVAPSHVRDQAARVQGRGAAFLDAPFTGSKDAAASGSLVYFVGGDEAVVRRVEPILKATGKAVIPVGKLGDAMVVKIAGNVLASAIVQGLAEALALVSHSGVDPVRFGDAMMEGATGCPLVEMKLPKMVGGDFDTHFALKHMLKDLKYALEVAGELDLNLPGTAAIGSVLLDSIDRGWGELDYSVIARLLGVGQAQPDAAPTGRTPQNAPETAAAPEAAVAGTAEVSPAGSRPLPVSMIAGGMAKPPGAPIVGQPDDTEANPDDNIPARAR